MIRIILTFLIFLIFAFSAQKTFAQSNSFVSIVNPIRGSEFWEVKDQSIDKVVKSQAEILTKYNLSATWLIRADALDSKEILNLIKKRSHDEKGLFLEITPGLTNLAGVNYHKSENWHDAGSAFLSGYERDEREKLIDASFGKFKEVFGYYPSSVGAWWIDAYSLEYMQRKYDIVASLIVADQYTTDNYQIWGQFWSTPYFPSKRNALHPAANLDDKLPVVIMQWAARDPVNAYGNGVQESTYSIQANDYLDYHNLDTSYFSKLVDIYTNQHFNKFAHLVVGLENSYDWEKYKKEYERQIEVLVKKRNAGQFSIVPMKDFARFYIKNFPEYSPWHVIEALDPLGREKRVVWFMNLNYRVGWFFNQDGSVIRDIHQYTGGEEICFIKRCDEVNFATGATRVLDEVSFGHKWVIDQGQIKNFKLFERKGNLSITYMNEAGNQRSIQFLEKDIGIDGKTTSVDGAILTATEQNLLKEKPEFKLEEGFFKWSPESVFLKTLRFTLFLIFGCFASGYVLISRIPNNQINVLQKIFLSIVLGFVIFTLFFYVFSLVHLKQLIFVYFFINFMFFIKFFILTKEYKGVYQDLFPHIKNKFSLAILILVLGGSVFQIIPTFKNALQFPYGLGFWGPNTHDGVWHISLINQLIKSVPPQNPILGGEILKNYHYFYDVLVASTSYILDIPASDLVFRLYPIVFSILLGIGSYYLVMQLISKNLSSNQRKLALLFALYLVYFAGSFGWIVENIKGRGFGGESNFWANQTISFNLNPPFAISLLIVIAIIQLLPNINKKIVVTILTIFAGSLISFKAYGGVLILLTLLLLGLFKRSAAYFMTFILSSLLSLVLFLSNFTFGKQLIIFSPFWFIHSMIDSPDRVGWVRLSLARETGFTQSNPFKFITSEIISLIIFVLGNLGTRFFALLSILKPGAIIKQNQYLFLFIFSSLALIIPVLFIQQGNPWNTIQFIYYFLYVSAVSGGLIFAKIITKINKFLALFFILIFLIITPVNSWATANGYLSYRPHALISMGELGALKFLELREDGVILTYPYDKKLKNKLSEPWPLLVYDSTGYVSAFSKKATFLEDESQNQILLTDYKRRIVASYDFFLKSELEKDRFLRNNNINYIYIPKIYDIKLDESIQSVEKIFENDTVVIYKVKEIK